MRKGFKKNKKGFTLIELIIVIAILAILAAVAIPSFVGLQNEAKRGRDIGNATAIVTAVNAWNAVYPDSIVKDKTNLTAVESSNFWPKGMTEETAALAYVNIDANGVATVINTTAAPVAS